MAVRDKEWLTLEACREFQRGTCSRTDQECKYAHPSNSVLVENGRVIACYDSMKGQCTRENCRYLHPPPHLKTQLEIKGQNNIAARRMLQNQLQNQLLAQQATATGVPLQPALIPSVPTSLPTPGTSTIATSQTSADVNAYYHGQPYMIPVAVTMAQTGTHGTISPHMYPASYLSQMQTALPTIATSAGVGSANPATHPAFSEIPLQTQIIPAGTPGTPSFQLLPVKAKNDRLEYHVTVPSNSMVSGLQSYGYGPAAPSPKKLSTNRKRPREEEDYLLMWNLKEEANRWQASQDYTSYLQSPSISACIPRPPKMHAGMVMQPQLAQSASMFPSNLFYNAMTPMAVMPQQQHYLPAHFPMMTTPGLPLMTPHFLPSQHTSESLPVCRDFKSGNCKRPNCKYAHVIEDKVEIVEGKVTLCRDAAKGKCMRTNCKYYHVPITATNGLLPATATANVTAASATF